MLNLKYLIWASLAGAFIPLIGILNGRVGRALGEPFYACVVVFVVAIAAAMTASVLFGKQSPSFHELHTLKPMDYIAGLIPAFYVLSATVLAPKIGVANFIVMAVSAQIICSLFIDHFGLFGAFERPINFNQFIGAILLLVGLVITQLANNRLD